MTVHLGLSKRERQIMDVVYALGNPTATQVVERLGAQANDASIRKLMRILEAKGFLAHERRGHAYVYRPTMSHRDASRSAIRHVLDTFFQGSAPSAVAALLDVTRNRLSRDDIASLNELIERAAKKGR